jgi:uncharacterized protein
MSSTFGPTPTPSPVDWHAAGLFYHSLNFFYRKKFGSKVWKLSLDAGCDCPNRDGTLATCGCIFCDPESFSPSRRLGLDSITDQIDEGIRRLKGRYAARRFVAYFQPGTNTYGPIDRLRRAYEQAIAHPDIVGVAIGTRPDCVGEDVLDLLAELARQTWVVLEYGLQTSHDRTLDLLNRGHHYDAFLDAHRRTRARNLDIGVHVILGLPGESRDDMWATACQLANLGIHSVKLHNLYAVRNTALAVEVAAGRIRLPEFQEYVEYAVDFLEQLPQSVVIERLCGDAPREYLVGPQWCLDKSAVRAAVEAEFRRRGSYQGYKVTAGKP